MRKGERQTGRQAGPVACVCSSYDSRGSLDGLPLLGFGPGNPIGYPAASSMGYLILPSCAHRRTPTSRRQPTIGVCPPVSEPSIVSSRNGNQAACVVLLQYGNMNRYGICYVRLDCVSEGLFRDGISMNVMSSPALTLQMWVCVCVFEPTVFSPPQLMTQSILITQSGSAQSEKRRPDGISNAIHIRSADA